MDFRGLQEFLPIISVLAPGFIMLWSRSIFISGKLPDIKEGAFYYVVISLVYYSIVVPLLSLLSISEVVEDILLFIVLPLLVGIMLGIAYQKGWSRRISGWLGLKVMHAAPCAWDYGFGSLNGYNWVTLELRDGRRVRGLFGPGSFASSGEGGTDLYLEELTDEEFNRFPRKASLWIRRSDIAMIEITPDQGGRSE